LWFVLGVAVSPVSGGGAGSANCYQKNNLCCMLLSLDSVILFYFGVLQILEKHPTSIKTFHGLVKYQSQTGSTLELSICNRRIKS
jgi:hypothetical protein